MLARLLLVVFTLGLAQGALAADVDPYVARAESLMDEAEYRRAQQIIDRGLARQGLDETTLRELYFLEGTVWVSLGQPGRARSSYAKVLTLDPTFRLGPRAPRKVRESFEATREEMLRRGDLASVYAVEHTPLGNLVPGQAAEARLAFGNAERAADIDRVVLHVRRLGTSDFAAIDASPVEVEGRTTYVARLPSYLLAREPEPYAMEYYLDAYTAGGQARVAGAGNPELPLTFLVVPEATLAGEGLEDEGVSWVPIAIGGAVAGAALVAAGVVGAVFLLAPKTGSATVIVRPATP